MAIEIGSEVDLRVEIAGEDVRVYSGCVYLTQDEMDSPFLKAYSTPQVKHNDLEKKYTFVEIPIEQLEIFEDEEGIKLFAKRSLLSENGWGYESGVLSPSQLVKTRTSINKMKGPHKKFKHLPPEVRNYWKHLPRYEIWGPHEELVDSVIELHSGLYSLDFPSTHSKFTKYGIAIEMTNSGKNAFRHPGPKRLREELKSSGKEGNDSNVLNLLEGEPNYRGMHLFFRRENIVNEEDCKPRHLFAMRPSPEGVIDLVDLHKNTSFDESEGKIIADRGQLGYWVGENGEFIKYLSYIYGKTIDVEETTV